jgi:hypothetical protein
LKLINYFVPRAYFVKFRFEQHGMILCLAWTKPDNSSFILWRS